MPIHTIRSNHSGDYKFSFQENEEIEDLVYSMDSTEYNPRLSHFLACMARSAYNEDIVLSNYEILGFDNDSCKTEHYENNDKIAGFTIGEKILDNGRVFVLITIRGSFTQPEWTETDFNLKLRESELSSSVGIHSGFEDSEIALYESLKDHLGGTIQKQNITYVITGHSLGGAVGNLLSVRLYNDGVSNKDVYNYNFGCPLIGAGKDSASVWNNQGAHDNIINIGDLSDKITYYPSSALYSKEELYGNMRKGWTYFKRFGISYWFIKGVHSLTLSAHDMSSYLEYLDKEYDENHFITSEYIVKTVSVHCPVDVIIYDNQGKPLAGTDNNEPNYYGYEIGEKAIIFVK